MDPLVSVIIPTYNGAKYIRETLDSVLAQTYRPLEILVVDDGSSDSTRDVAASYPGVILLHQERRGHPAARNRGLRSASGEFLSFLDHDDLWEPAKIEMQLECFRIEPELDLVFGHICNFFSPEMPAEARRRVSVPLHPLPGLLQGAMLATRTAFERVGRFSEERDLGDFLDWYGRAMILGLKTRMLPATVLHRRIHLTNYTRAHPNLHRQYLTSVKQLLDQRRTAQKGEA
jgi:glycosyltransferase involved in cell wall biosynthesis